MKKIYAGNLSFNTTEDALRSAFSKFGTVESVRIVKDKFTEMSKGFGFIEMEDENALKAIAAMNGKMLDGRKIRVNETKEKI